MRTDEILFRERWSLIWDMWFLPDDGNLLGASELTQTCCRLTGRLASAHNQDTQDRVPSSARQRTVCPMLAASFFDLSGNAYGNGVMLLPSPSEIFAMPLFLDLVDAND